jgi:hypothetical protein
VQGAEEKNVKPHEEVHEEIQLQFYSENVSYILLWNGD